MDIRGIIFGTLMAACTAGAFPAHAALVPPNFFDQVPEVGAGQAGVEADHLEYNQFTDVITASGNVTVTYAGYFARGDRLVFNQSTRDLELVGNVYIVDPGGIEYSADSISVTGGLKRAMLNSMVMETPDGTRITAARTDKQAGGVTVMDDVAYTPCGACVDEHGHRIGWRVRTQRITYNSEAGYVDIEQPILEVLGVPIAWFPWLRLPDPADLRPTGFQFPSYQYNDDIGIKLNVPYYQALNRDMNFLLTPSLIQKQGVLLGARFNHNVGDWGAYNVRGHWIHQFDPASFAGEVGNLDERWSIQTSGRFTPTENWTTGWSYMRFSDRDFVGTYMIGHSATNQVYANYLDDKTYFDIRAQEFLELGNVTQAKQDKQGVNLPVSEFAHTEDLGEAGQVTVSAELRNVQRAADHTRTANGLTYAHGYKGNKVHGTAEASWQKQWIAPGGIAFEPTIGLRFDAASYDGASALNPTASTLYTATPFAALDVRYPWQASGNGVTHVVEPIAQVVYHGNSTSTVGITNDDAQSFIFDDTQVFSYNRFSGSDRQETGLRANVGGHYMVDFENGTYIDFAAGQSFHLAGTNAFAQPDQTHIDKRTAFAGGKSEFVAGVNGRLAPWIDFGAKAAFDPTNGQLTRTSARAGFSHEGWSVNADYAYVAPNAAIGATKAQQDIGGSISIPVWEYWTANAFTEYDLTASQFMDYGAGLTYDDGYVVAGANVSSSGPLSFDPGAWSYKLSFKLKTADGSAFGL